MLNSTEEKRGDPLPPADLRGDAAVPSTRWSSLSAPNTTSKNLWLGFGTLIALLVLSSLMAIANLDTLELLGIELALLMVGIVVAVLTSLAVGRAVLSGQRDLAEQSERLRTTLASIGDAVIATDTTGRITSLNAVAETLTGWTANDAVGQPLDVIFRIVNESTRRPADNPAVRALREGVIVGLANHTLLIAKDGTERPIDDSAAPIRCQVGEIVGCVLVFRDVTERRQTELAAAERSRLVALRADVSAALASSRNSQAVLQSCATALVEHLDMAFARIWTLDDSEDVLEELQASAGQYTHLDGPHSRVKVGEYKIGRIAANRKPHLTNSTYDDANVSDQDWAKQEGLQAFAGYPLLVDDRVVGVVAMFSRQTLSEGVLSELAPLADGIAQYIDRQRAFDRLIQSEQHATDIVDSIADGLITVDRQWRITSMNARGEQIVAPLQKTRSSVIGKVFWDEFPATIGTIAEDNYRSAMREQSTREFELYFEPLSRWFDIRAYPSREGLSLYFLDITGRKQSEAALQSSEDRVRLALDSADLGSWHVDPATMSLVTDRKFRDIFGVVGESIDYEQAVSAIYPDDRDRVRAAVEASACPENPAPYAIEYRVVRLDGSIRWVFAKGRANVEVGNSQKRLLSFDGTVADITEQKQTESALKSSEERFRMLFETMDEGFCVIELIFDQDGQAADYRFLETNPAFEGHTGLSSAVGKTIREMVPDHESHWFEIYGRVATTGEPIRFVHNAKAMNDRWFDVNAFKLGGPDSRKVAVLFNDISDRKRAEQSLRDSEERFRQIAESVDAVFYVTDIPERSVRYVSPALSRLWDIEPDELYRDPDAWPKRIHPEDRSAMLDAFDSFLSGGPPVNVEYRIRLQNGAERWVRDRASVAARDPSGAISRITGIAEDITERRQAEQAIRESEARFRNMADNAPIMVWVTEPQGDCVYLSKSWYEFTGQTAETGLGHGWLSAVHPDDWAAASEGCAEATANHGAYHVEFRLRRADGEYRWVIDAAAPRFAPDGQFLGHIGSVIDIEERKVLENDLRKMASDLRDADRRKDEFLATLAHELRNPLAPIRNSLEIIAQSNGNGEALLSARQTMQRQLSHMVRLIDDLLDVSRISRGKIELRKAQVELASIIYQAVETCRPAIEAAGQQLAVKLPEQPIYLHADPVRLAQVFSNLLNNAGKYSEPGGRIEVEAHVLKSEMSDEWRVTSGETKELLAKTKESIDGGQTLSRTESLADVDDASRTVLPGDEKLSQGRAVRHDDADTTGGSFDPGEHRGRPGAAAHEGVSQLPEHRSRVADGSGNTFSAQPARGLDSADSARLLVEDSGRSQSNAGGSSQSTRSEASELATHHSPLTTACLVCSIKDAGIGIPPDMLPNIFEMFTQVDQSLERSQGGLGIGLTLVRRLVELHGGTVSAQSEGLGRGSEFVVQLPLALSLPSEGKLEMGDAWRVEGNGKQAHFDDAADTHHASPTTGHPSPNVRHRILVVDDNRDSARSLAMLLGLGGHETHTAHDGLEALAAAEKILPDLILLDIGMPNLNGYDAARRIRQQPWGTSMQLVALTGWGQADDRRKSSEAGFNGHLVKPVDYQTLLKLLSELLPRTDEAEARS